MVDVTAKRILSPAAVFAVLAAVLVAAPPLLPSGVRPVLAQEPGGTITASGGGDVPLGSTFTVSFRLDAVPGPYTAFEIGIIYSAVSAGGSLRYMNRVIDWVIPPGNPPFCPPEPARDWDLGGLLAPPIRVATFACVTTAPPEVTVAGPLAHIVFQAEALGPTAIHMTTPYEPYFSMDASTFTLATNLSEPQLNTLACSGSCGPLPGFPMTQPWDVVVNVVPAPADTDGDGYTDAQEIALGTSPTTFCKVMRADVNMDAKANLLDLGALAGWFGQNVPPAPARYDQGQPPRDNKINLLDLGSAASVFGLNVSTCP